MFEPLRLRGAFILEGRAEASEVLLKLGKAQGTWLEVCGSFILLSLHTCQLFLCCKFAFVEGWYLTLKRLEVEVCLLFSVIDSASFIATSPLLW